MGQGVDYSWARPDLQCLPGWGKSFIMRYVALGSLEKLLSSAESYVARANGLAIVTLAEGWEDQALNGYGQGYQDAQQSYAWARIVGMPENRPVYFAVDFDAQSWQMGAIEDYLNGCADAIGRQNVGVYGSVRVVNAMAERGAAQWFYQAAAWSYGEVSPYTHIWQYQNRVMVCGGECDLDQSLTDDFGQWGQDFYQPPAGGGGGGADSSGLPDVHEDGPWDFAPHIDALADKFADLGANLGAYARGVESLRNY